jgi:hypothetical protein
MPIINICFLLPGTREISWWPTSAIIVSLQSFAVKLFVVCTSTRRASHRTREIVHAWWTLVPRQSLLGISFSRNSDRSALKVNWWIINAKKDRKKNPFYPMFLLSSWSFSTFFELWKASMSAWRCGFFCQLLAMKWSLLHSCADSVTIFQRGNKHEMEYQTKMSLESTWYAHKFEMNIVCARAGETNIAVLEPPGNFLQSSSSI